MVPVRPAAGADFAAIAAIYGHHVLNSLAMFEVDPPSQDEMQRRLRALAERGLPFLVAENGGTVAGYARATPYCTREAYRFSVENSVYVDPAMTGRGTGRALLAALIEACENKGHRQMVAIIGDSGSDTSIGLHAALGFERAGLLRGVGFKAGRWVDCVVMQRALGDGERKLPDI